MKIVYTPTGLRRKASSMLTSTPMTEALVRKARELTFHRGRHAKIEIRGGTAHGSKT